MSRIPESSFSWFSILGQSSTMAPLCTFVKISSCFGSYIIEINTIISFVDLYISCERNKRKEKEGTEEKKRTDHIPL